MYAGVWLPADKQASVSPAIKSSKISCEKMRDPTRTYECEKVMHLALVFQQGGQHDPWQPSGWRRHVRERYSPC